MKKLSTQELLKTIKRVQIQTQHLADDVLAGAYHSAFKGRGIEFEEVREYQMGDEIRSIDWNVTARMNRPFIKLFKEERELTVLLMIDISASCQFGTEEATKNRLIAEMGALLAFSAIKNNDKVGLILFANGVEKYLPPQKGLRHVLRVIKELLDPAPSKKGTNLSQALAFAGKVHPRSAVCFVLSDFLSQDFTQEWALLAHRYDLIAIDVSSPYEEQFPAIGLVAIQDLETGEYLTIDTSTLAMQASLRQLSVQRKDKLKKLCHGSGSSLINLSTEESPLEALKKFFKVRSRRVH